MIRRSALAAGMCLGVFGIHIHSSVADVAPEPIILGATIPLTGDSATYGKLIRDGLSLAESRLRDEGYAVRMVYEDVPAPGQPAITALQKMLAVDHIDGLVANFFNGNIPAMAPLIAHSRLPVLHSAIADDLILAAGSTVFTTNATIAQEAHLLSEYAADVLRAKTAAILFVGTTFGEGYAKHFRRSFQARGGSIVFEQMSALGNDDHRAELARLAAVKPDVIIAAFFGTNLGALLKQKEQFRIETPILTVYEAEDPSVTSVGGAGANGIRFFEPEPDSDDRARTAFKSEFLQRYGYAPRVLAANAYDAAILLTKALSSCEKNPECVVERIQSVRDYHGASGSFSIAPNRAAIRVFTLKTCLNGIFLPAESLPRAIRARLGWPEVTGHPGEETRDGFERR